MAVLRIVSDMVDARARDTQPQGSVLERCIEALADCAQACTECADDCLAGRHDSRDTSRCIRLCQDCADIGAATQRVLSRRLGYDPGSLAAQLRAAIAAADACRFACADLGAAIPSCARNAEICAVTSETISLTLAALPELDAGRAGGGRGPGSGMGRAITPFIHGFE
ncbi:MAG: hypothetical protein WAP37_00885 [Solirubrobacterales bacterium]